MPLGNGSLLHVCRRRRLASSAAQRRRRLRRFGDKRLAESRRSPGRGGDCLRAKLLCLPMHCHPSVRMGYPSFELSNDGELSALLPRRAFGSPLRSGPPTPPFTASPQGDVSLGSRAPSLRSLLCYPDDASLWGKKKKTGDGQAPTASASFISSRRRVRVASARPVPLAVAACSPSPVSHRGFIVAEDNGPVEAHLSTKIDATSAYTGSVGAYFVRYCRLS